MAFDLKRGLSSSPTYPPTCSFTCRLLALMNKNTQTLLEYDRHCSVACHNNSQTSSCWLICCSDRACTSSPPRLVTGQQLLECRVQQKLACALSALLSGLDVSAFGVSSLPDLCLLSFLSCLCLWPALPCFCCALISAWNLLKLCSLPLLACTIMQPRALYTSYPITFLSQPISDCIKRSLFYNKTNFI